MANYARIFLGQGSKFATWCHKENFIGVDFEIYQDLTDEFPESWKEFNKKYIPVIQSNNPEKSNKGAGLSCGMLWTFGRGLPVGSIVLCPTGEQSYYLGQISTPYYYAEGEDLPHRRGVEWFPSVVEISSLSKTLLKVLQTGLTVIRIDDHSKEIDSLVDPVKGAHVSVNDEFVEDPIVFALEVYLQEFLVTNWKNTSLGKKYKIYEVDGDRVAGNHFQTDTGPLDILAESHDGKELLVIELKKGKTPESVIGQITRYMGFVKDVVATEGQRVSGMIIAFEDNLKLQRSLLVVPDIDFYRYEINFSLHQIK